jgi:PrtD family type I secretion system ABC transporter
VSQKVSAPILKASNEENAEATKVAADSLRQAETALAMGMLPAIRDKWFGRHKAFLQLQVNATEASGVMKGVGSLLSNSLPSLQIAFGAWLALEGQITGGMVIAASMLISKAMNPMVSLILSWDSIISARQAYDKLNILLEEDESYASQMALPPPIGHLQVSDLVLVPPGSAKVVMNGANFSVVPGNILAVIGPSASGKSCLARALMGVWKPFKGSVRLDGVEISDWAREEVGPYLGYVPQELEFFAGTIAENIARFGEVDADEVVEAARIVGVHLMILQMPNGYDTQIGPGGFTLSGGQKQSLALARAFYKRPRFVVLDEPNSNLDDASEQSFRAALDAMRAANTAIIIMTHDSRLARVADYLLVLRDGRQIGFGTPQEMLAAIKHADVSPTVKVKPEVQISEEMAAEPVKSAPGPMADKTIPKSESSPLDLGALAETRVEIYRPIEDGPPKVVNISVAIQSAGPVSPSPLSPDRGYDPLKARQDAP